ncbi:ElyC/SanA/YdcF family protein [Falsiroseomonas sp.]|uniref:ElyC/SanA/YdcF family protein n=1 Tax=Falsiroseomonas sp. TaxID=2870721 RepID=UPI002719C840|nr:ElyC/SanA/YdcF family protein [Falsiroseomonas sp.]MDO9501282.1 ElyC/SanA/YdcF family protein [Falsiroseomonas sp.]
MAALDPAGIERDHCLCHPREAADLAFVFGNRIAVPGMAAAAALLFLDGLVPRILVSGGATPGGPGTEADAIGAAILALGVPRDALLLERRATHTGENVTLSLPILARAGLLNSGRIVCVGLFCTGRRYAMTLHHHWPAPAKRCLPVEYGPVRRGIWHLHPEARARVLGEVAKVPAYLAAGFIAPWPSASAPTK